jgi:hypothetical protein
VQEVAVAEPVLLDKTQRPVVLEATVATVRRQVLLELL